MAKYTIKRTWMRHTSGSKFYQVIIIASDEGDAVTAFHYARYRGDFTAFRKPVNGGIVQIVTGDEYSIKIADKGRRTSKGHYVAQDPIADTYSSGASLGLGLRKLFGSANAECILGRLGRSTSLGTGRDSDDEEPSGVVEDTPIEPEIDRGEGWGSW